MHSHLVAVEVGIERRTSEGMQLDCLAFDHLWLEGLDAEAVQCRGTVQQNGMSLHDELEDVPDDGILAVHNLLGALHSLHDATLDEFTDDEGLVEFCCHKFGDTALAHLQFGTNHDDRTG